MAKEERDLAAGYTECYVAFLDILGFKELVTQSMRDARVLQSLIKGLAKVASLGPSEFYKRDVHFEGKKCTGISNEKQWVTQIRSFSDCIAIFIPTETHALSWVAYEVRYLHDRLLELGYLLRGAMTIGDMYWNDTWSYHESERSTNDKEESESNAPQQIIYDRTTPSNDFITLGPALVEAYKLESTVAIYPRVIFSRGLMAHIKEMQAATPENGAEDIHNAAKAFPLCLPSAENHARCILDFIRTDEDDGVLFLDLFHKDIDRNDVRQIVAGQLPNGGNGIRCDRDGMTHEDFMRNTRATIEGLLNKNAVNCEKVHVKLCWFKNYLNKSIERNSIGISSI